MGDIIKFNQSLAKINLAIKIGNKLIDIAHKEKTDLIPFFKMDKNGIPRWGYANKDRVIVVPCLYDEVSEVQNGIGKVYLEDKTYLVDSNGNLLIEDNKEEKNNLFFLLSKNYDYVSGFRNGMAIVSFNGKYGYVGMDGRLQIPCIYDSVKAFIEDTAIVCINDKYGLINKKGDFKIPAVYDMLYNMDKGYFVAKIKLEEDHYSFLARIIDENNNILFEDTVNEIETAPFSEDYALIAINKKYGYINKSGTLEIPCIYDDGSSFADGMACVLIGLKLGYIDKKGKIKVPLIYDYDSNSNIRTYSEGLVAVKQDNKWGFVDKKGEVVIPFKYDDASDFGEGLVGVELENKWGFINTKGEIVIPFIYKCIFVSKFKNGLCLLTLKDFHDHYLQGYIDKKGTQYWED